MAGINVSGDVIVDYAKKVDDNAAELRAAAEPLGAEDVAPEAFGGLGTEIGLGESYARASEALRGQLIAGSEALKSAGEALHQVVAKHSDGDEEAAEMIARVNR
ncbi:hypothetical protein AB5J62_02495 [Amycolatopsis sp. cg5]|uniref:hypothetical protein n=1 Tax=Amycolatopsis sp. cg5 TaxID=3238802 RepID=UPI003524EB7D